MPSPPCHEHLSFVWTFLGVRSEIRLNWDPSGHFGCAILMRGIARPAGIRQLCKRRDEICTVLISRDSKARKDSPFLSGDGFLLRNSYMQGGRIARRGNPSRVALHWGYRVPGRDVQVQRLQRYATYGHLKQLVLRLISSDINNDDGQCTVDGIARLRFDPLHAR